MACDKQFKFAGVSLHKGQFTVRYANNMNRIATLKQNGHSEIQLFELPLGSSFKEDAVDFLLGLDLGIEANNAVKEEARLLGFIV